MKEIIKLLAIFLFIFLIILCSLAFLNVLYLMFSTSGGAEGISLAHFLVRIPVGILNVLPSALMLSVLIMFSRISLRPAPSLPASLIIALAAGAIFIGGLLGITSVQTKVKLSRSQPEDVIIPGRINRFDRLVVIPAGLEYDFLLDCVVLDLNAKQTKFSVYPRAKGTIQAGKMILDFDELVFSTELEDPSRKYLRDYDAFSSDILQAFQVFNDRFINLARQPGWDLYFSACVFIFFLMASGLFSRITRWPLFNLFFYGLILTGIVLLFGYYIAEIKPELEKIMENTRFLDSIPNFTLLGLSVLFILIDTIFVPRKYWKEGIESD